jgi:hypothetical protein
VFFFFQKKKQKALVCFAEGCFFHNCEAGLEAPPDINCIFFFFWKKKQKALSCFREDRLDSQLWAKPTPFQRSQLMRVVYFNSTLFLLKQKKRSNFQICKNLLFHPNLGEADPWGLVGGRAPKMVYKL